MSEQPTTPAAEPKRFTLIVQDAQPDLRIIGAEWLEHGYENFHVDDPPPPCIIDGTPMNACTH